MRVFHTFFLALCCTVLVCEGLLNINLGEHECEYGAKTPTSSACLIETLHFKKFSSSFQYFRLMFKKREIKYIRCVGSKLTKLDCVMSTGGVDRNAAEVKIRNSNNLKDNEVHCEAYCERGSRRGGGGGGGGGGYNSGGYNDN